MRTRLNGTKPDLNNNKFKFICVPPSVHRDAKRLAAAAGMTLAGWVARVVQREAVKAERKAK